MVTPCFDLGVDIEHSADRDVVLHPMDAMALDLLSPRLPRPAGAGPAVLALDLGTLTGWALQDADGAIVSGTEVFRHDRWQGGGMRFLRFKTWLTNTKAAVGTFDSVVFEEARAHAGTDAAHVFGGFLAILTAWCEHHGIAYEGVPVGTIKRFVAGKGNASKAEVIAAVTAKGFHPTDDNEADALALLLWALAHRFGGGAA